MALDATGISNIWKDDGSENVKDKEFVDAANSRIVDNNYKLYIQYASSKDFYKENLNKKIVLSEKVTTKKMDNNFDQEPYERNTKKNFANSITNKLIILEQEYEKKEARWLELLEMEEAINKENE